MGRTQARAAGGIYGTPENMLPAGSSTYTYDALGRLGTYQEGPVTESYGYGCDKIGLNQKTLI